MEVNTKFKTSKESSVCTITLFILITFIFSAMVLLIVSRSQVFPFDSFATRSFASLGSVIANTSNERDRDDTRIVSLNSKLRDSVTFLPLKDLRYSETAMTGHTWFMSSLNDTQAKDEAEYIYFPSETTTGRLLCIKGRDTHDGTKNSYALAWKESLPDSATFLEGLTFVSDTYYDYVNLWHGLCAMIPFVGWSVKHHCLKPTRWVLFHWGELRPTMGSWLQHLMKLNYGDVPIEKFDRGEGPYCFEKAVVMRHNLGKMGKQNKLLVSELLRCKARSFCNVYSAGRHRDINEKGEPIIRLTLLLRRGSRSFKNASLVTDIFSRECAKVEGCLFKVAQSDDLNFCQQVKLLTDTDIVASPHGAQLTNMLFMDRNSNVMEFFPKGWLELAGAGQYAHHWLADITGMKHRGAWWDQLGQKDCPSPQNELECFLYYKDGQIGHNETYFAEWARTVINQVRRDKLEQTTRNTKQNPSSCLC